MKRVRYALPRTTFKDFSSNNIYLYSQAMNDLASDEEIFAEKNRENSELKARIQDMESSTEKEGQAYEDAAERIHQQESQLVEQQTQIQELQNMLHEMQQQTTVSVYGGNTTCQQIVQFFERNQSW